jgi:hypothetical protein
MKTTRDDEPTPPQEDARSPETWPAEPAGQPQGAAAAAPDDPTHETLEEPGYGHGV